MATGEHVRRRAAETRGDLTAEEPQVALLARDGMSNVEIGAQLFLTRHTVAYHLRKVFSKLGSTHAGSWPARSRGPNPSRSLPDLKRPERMGFRLV